jgi:hypothetical protein
MYERGCRFFVSRANALAEKGILFSLFKLYIGDNHTHKRESLDPWHQPQSHRQINPLKPPTASTPG